MLDKTFYEWLQLISEDEHFISAISIGDRLMKEKYNMELALRFVILNTIDPAEVRGINDFSEFITAKMVNIVKNIHFNRNEMEARFRQTFLLLDNILGDTSFKKFSDAKGRFEGSFLVAAYEAVAIGVGKNIHLWEGIEITAALVETFTDKVKSIWSNEQFKARYGAGVNVTSRVPVIVPLGESILKP